MIGAIQQCDTSPGDVVFTVNLNFDAEFRAEDRFCLMGNRNFDFSCVLGTTYANDGFPSEPLGSRYLDTFYSTHTVEAIADGYMHYADDMRNQAICAVANCTLETLVTLSRKCDDAHSLFQALPGIFQRTGDIVRERLHTPDQKEEAGALFTATFAKNAHEREIVTGSVGDAAAIAWIPETQKVVVLAHPRQYKVHGVFDPMAVTEPLTGGMVQKSFHVLPSSIFVIRMTDGAWQSFPYTSSRLHDTDAGYDYIEYQLDTDYLRAKLLSCCPGKEETNASDYAVFLRDLVFSETERKRANLKHVKEKLGEIMGEDSQGSLHEFYERIRHSDPEFFVQFTEFLRDFERPIEDLSAITLEQFRESLQEGVYMGDDVLISISKYN